MKPIHFLGLLFLIVGYFAFKVFYPFLGTMTIAILLAIATYKIHQYFSIKIPSRVLAALASTILLGIIFFAPIIYILTNAASFVTHIDFDILNQSVNSFKQWLESTIKEYHILSNYQEYTAQIDLAKIVNWLIQTASYLGKKSANFLKDIVLILIFYFFAQLYGREVLLYFQNIIPLKKEDSYTLFVNLAGIMGVVFNSIIATAVLEGFLFGIIAQIYGYNGLMFGILYGFASLIPVVGGIIMWLPLSIDRYFHHDLSGAIVIALYSIIVISFIADTLIKPLIIHYIDRLMLQDTHIRVNELLIFFSIVAGLSSYGFWGMIIGPAVITLLISILNIYPKLANSSQ